MSPVTSSGGAVALAIAMILGGTSLRAAEPWEGVFGIEEQEDGTTIPSCEGDLVRYSRQKIEGSEFQCDVLSAETDNGVTTLKATCKEGGESGGAEPDPNANVSTTVRLEPKGDRIVETWDNDPPQTSARCPETTPITPSDGRTGGEGNSRFDRISKTQGYAFPCSSTSSMWEPRSSSPLSSSYATSSLAIRLACAMAALRLGNSSPFKSLNDHRCRTEVAGHGKLAVANRQG